MEAWNAQKRLSAVALALAGITALAFSVGLDMGFAPGEVGAFLVSDAAAGAAGGEQKGKNKEDGNGKNK